MNSIVSRRQLRTLLLAAYLPLVTAIIYALLSNWAYDDPYITYRYARNLADGLGFVYNPGQRVLSTTTPFFTLLLAALGYLWSDLPHLANLIGAFSLALGGVFVWELGRAWRAPAVSWVGLLLYPTFSLLLITFGSETPLYLALCLGSFAFYARKRYRLTAALAALAMLTRPDGLLVPVLLASHYLLSIRRSIPWRAVVLFLVLSLPWFLFAWVYFGSPLPATLVAKQHQGSLLVSQRFAAGLITILKNYSGHWENWLLALLALLGVYRWLRRARRWSLFFAWTVLYFISYSILGVSRYFWYYAPLVPGFLVAAGLGLEALRRLPSSTRWNLPALLASSMLLLVAWMQVYDLWLLPLQDDGRAAIYRAIGEWLQDNAPPEAAVGSLEVGIIGYYAPQSFVDFAGLLQPDVAAQLTHGATYEKAAIYVVEHHQPDYLVLRKGDFNTLRQEYVQPRCQLVQHFAGELFGYAGSFNVYTCP